MIYDFEDPAIAEPTHAEICIVGAGAAGVALATVLAAAGRSVLLLEGGGLRFEKESQAIYESEIAGLPHDGLHNGRFRLLGGTTTAWGGQVLELDDADFMIRSHVPGSGWPFPKSELLPFYQQAAVFEGLEKSEPGNDAGRLAVCEDLGLQPLEFGPEFTQSLSRWCVQRNFATAHHAALETERSLAVYVHANVVCLTLNEQRTKLQSLKIQTLDGRTADVSANRFVFCLGGIETTRLLLQPASVGIFPWQSNGLLGCFFQDHITCDQIMIHDVAAQPVQRYFGSVLSKGTRYQTKIQLSAKEQAKRELLNVAGSIVPYERRDFKLHAVARMSRRMRHGEETIWSRELVNALPHLPRLGANWLEQRVNGGEYVWRATMLKVHCEQSPNSRSSITLADVKDALGLFRTRMDWHISEHEIKTIRAYVALVKKIFSQTGFASVVPPEGFFEDDAVLIRLCKDNNHHMGSTRMSACEAQGIVDPDLRLHGVANAYVCSTSVFPCSGFANPTHTLLALAMRLANTLVTRFAQGEYE